MAAKTNGKEKTKEPATKTITPLQALKKLVFYYEQETGASAAHTRVVDMVHWYAEKERVAAKP